MSDSSGAGFREHAEAAEVLKALPQYGAHGVAAARRDDVRDEAGDEEAREHVRRTRISRVGPDRNWMNNGGRTNNGLPVYSSVIGRVYCSFINLDQLQRVPFFT